MSLEDGFTDVIAKAMRGLGIDVASLAKAAGISACEIDNLLGGVSNEAVSRALCPALGLDADALMALPRYLPLPVAMTGVRRIELPFGKWSVNAWELEMNGIRLLFDAGYGARDILEKISPYGLEALLVTHAHSDHIGGVSALAAAGVRVFTETEALVTKKFSFNLLELESVDLSGHCAPATGYFVNGMVRQLFIPGDALFAGSMGGCKTCEAHELAGRTLRAALVQAEPGCVILPGHGPATTVAEELVSNPFKLRFA